MPSPKLRIENGVMFTGVVILMFMFHFVSTPLDSIIALVRQSDLSFVGSFFVFFIGFSLSLVVIYSGVDKYFLGWRHALRATAGTTLLVSIAYGIVWSLFQIGQAKESFVLFMPRQWNMIDTVNNLKAGTLLAIFSSIGLSNRLYFKDEGAYDFSVFQKDARDWKLVIEKRLTRKFEQRDHDRLLHLTKSMMDRLDARNGWVQPAVEAAAIKLRVELEEFDAWYRNQTAGGLYTEFRGFDPLMANKVRQMENLF